MATSDNNATAEVANKNLEGINFTGCLRALSFSSMSRAVSLERLKCCRGSMSYEIQYPRSRIVCKRRRQK
jgi:hypothetical protein